MIAQVQPLPLESLTPAEIDSSVASLLVEIDDLSQARRAALNALAASADDPDALAAAAARLAQIEIRLRALDERRAGLQNERPDAERRRLAAERDAALQERDRLQAQVDALAPDEAEAERRLFEIRAERARLVHLAGEQHERWRDRVQAIRRLDH